MEKSLTIQVGADLARLKEEGYRLCLAKQVQGYTHSNIVWRAYANFTAFTVFKWTPVYQIFAAPFFTAGNVVTEAGNVVEISLGQESTLDNNGNLSPAASSKLPLHGAFRIINNAGSLCLGIKQLATDINGEQTSLHNFVTTEQLPKGTLELTPIEQIMVWFQGSMLDGTMFDETLAPMIQPSSSPTQDMDFEVPMGAKTFAWLVDFSEGDTHTVKYEDQSWSLVG